jgi:urease accessory protein
MRPQGPVAEVGGDRGLCEREGGVQQGTRQVEAKLRFAIGGGRTVLTQQRVPYPYHVTRLFHLDPARPELATLYLQSAAGGLYCGDRLTLAIEVDPAAAVHVTTQAATIVHDTRGQGVTQRTQISIAPQGFAALSPDPLVLFPGAAITNTTEVLLRRNASCILVDGFACHDPRGEGRRFERFSAATTVRDDRGEILLADSGCVLGTDLRGDAGPLGPYRAVGTVLVLGRGADHLDSAALERRLEACGCLAGLSAAPNGLGLAGRILSADGGALGRGMECAFAWAFEALLGVPPTRRRK